LLKANEELYFARWGIETKYDTNTNQLQLEAYSGQKVITIVQDFFITFFLHCLQRFILYILAFKDGKSQYNYCNLNFISRSGWGLKWDFMMVHESGHEWFGNSITASSHGDTWIHEGFTKYLETLYTDYVFGTAAGNEYALGTWKRIKNDRPILGTNTSDKYYKGSAMLHMIRQIVGDTVFREWLRGLNRQYYHKIINTHEVLSLINRYSNKDLSKIFHQYLQTTKIPVLEYYFKDGEISYRWSNCVDGFNMPLLVKIGSQASKWIFPTMQWQSVKANSGSLKADVNFLVTLVASS
jgi:hypothetical protein